MSDNKLREWLLKQTKPEKNAERLAVCNAKPGGIIGGEICSFEIPEKIKINWIDETLADIEETTEQYADAIGGCQTYCAIMSFYESKNQSRYAFRVAKNDALDGVASEPASAEGLVAASMRHEEASLTILLRTINQAVASQQKTIETLTRQNEKLLAEKFETLATIEQMLSQKQQRELEAQRELRADELKSEMLGSVKLLAPVLISKMTGKPLPKELQQDTPELLAVKQLVESFSSEQFATIANALRPEQQLAFGAIVEKLGEDKN